MAARTAVGDCDRCALASWLRCDGGDLLTSLGQIDPPQGEVIEKILRHCGLWRGRAPRPPPDVAGVAHDLDGCLSDSQEGELTFVDMDTFAATF